MDMERQQLVQQTMAIVLAGGRGSRLQELTARRTKPAVYFGGKSRIIDFTLSNTVNSGIRRIGVATQYKAHSLIRHLQSGWSFFRAERNESLDIFLASQCMNNTHWYQGIADAIVQNIDIIISGAQLERCLLFTGVHAHSYSSLTGVVAMPHVQMERNTRLHNVIIDSGVHIPEDLVVGEDPVLDASQFRRTEQGVCLITSFMVNQLSAGG